MPKGGAMTMARNIVRAINYQFKSHIVVYGKEFYGRDNELVRMYTVRESYYDGNRWANDELFRSTSANYTLLFCRDLLFSLQGKEVPDPENDGYRKCKESKRADEKIRGMRERYCGDNRS